MARQNLTHRDLLKLLEVATPKPKENKNLELVKEFVTKLNIKSGKTRIPNYLIYYTYHNSTDNPMLRTAFFMQFKTLFKRAKINVQRFYLLDKSSFDLTSETNFKARSFTRKYNEKQKEKKQKG